MEASYNSRCPAVKRLFREAKELHEATEEYFAQPLEDNLFEWHFTVRGPPDTEFDGGIYHGRIIMPAEYPMKPPNIIFLTANGRFETYKKICLSISGHHPETWQPSWSIRTALLAIIGFMPTPANGTIGSLDYTANERAKLAKKSLEYVCPDCGNVSKVLKERTGDNRELQEEAREVMSQVTVSAKVENKSESEQPAAAPSAENGSTSPISSNEPVAGEDQPSSPTTTEVASGTVTSTSDDTNTDSSSTPQATSHTSLPGNTEREATATPTPAAVAEDTTTEMLMEGIAPRNPNAVSSSTPVSNSGYFYNIVLSSAIVVFVALLMRRLFLLEGDSSEELDDVLL